MKHKIITGFLLTILFTSLSSDINAAPWRGCRRGWCGPHPVVRGWLPPVRVVVPPVVVGGYYGPAYYGPAYYGPAYYGPAYRGGGYYGPGFRGGGYGPGYRGGGYHGGGNYGHGYHGHGRHGR